MLDLALLLLQPGGYWSVGWELGTGLSVFQMVLISAELTLVLVTLRLRLAGVRAAAFLSALDLLRFFPLGFCPDFLGRSCGVS